MLSAITAGAGVAVFAFQNFETVAAADRREAHARDLRIEDSDRLKRVEDKLDRLLAREK